MRTLRKLMAGLGIVLLLGLVAFYLVFFATRDRTSDLPGDRSIAVLEEVDLGGVPQSVLIRGHDTRNPVLLFLHGGPGMPAMFLAHDFQRAMERDFVMVHWDRRGAGKSFAYDGEQRVSQVVADTLEHAPAHPGLRRCDPVDLVAMQHDALREIGVELHR